MRGRRGLSMLVIALLFAAAHWLRARQAEQLKPQTGASELLAPVLLGGFKGLTVDLLWLRAIQLQEEGDFFELPFLYGLISELSPELTEAWSFNAFNMAYNLPAHEGTPEARWRWVRRGLLLIQEGLARNPQAGDLGFWHAYMLWHLATRDALSAGLDSEDRYAALFASDGELNPEGLRSSQAAFALAHELLQRPEPHTLRLDYVAFSCIEEELVRAVAEADSAAGDRWLRACQEVSKHVVTRHPEVLDSFEPWWRRILAVAQRLPQAADGQEDD